MSNNNSLQEGQGLFVGRPAPARRLRRAPAAPRSDGRAAVHEAQYPGLKLDGLQHRVHVAGGERRVIDRRQLADQVAGQFGPEIAPAGGKFGDAGEDLRPNQQPRGLPGGGGGGIARLPGRVRPVGTAGIGRAEGLRPLGEGRSRIVGLAGNVVGNAGNVGGHVGER